jgi:hypothetical protein
MIKRNLSLPKPDEIELFHIKKIDNFIKKMIFAFCCIRRPPIRCRQTARFGVILFTH